MGPIAKSPSERTVVDEARTAISGRNNAPVFVLGCPRSGTTLLYHMLLSAGDFAVYQAESNVFNLLAPRFHGMRLAGDREDLLKVWLRSKQFRVSGLDAAQISDQIMSQCRNAGDFLRITMEQIASTQGVRRWADCTPDHLLCMTEIKRQIPDALFIHIIRDGRDVALSYVQQKWAHPLPWDRNEQLGAAGLYWEWVVRKGRKQGQSLGADYEEVRFEELIENPKKTLERLGLFIEHSLDYEKIQVTGIGSVSKPNSSFSSESEDTFNPVARWKEKMSSEQVAGLEDLIGGYLEKLGYALASSRSVGGGLRATRLRTTYLSLFEAKQMLKRTVLGRKVDLRNLEIDSINTPDVGPDNG